MTKTFLGIASGPGIGLATARRFGSEGFRVVLAARTVPRLQADAAKLRDEGIEATTVQVDAADARAVARVVNSIGPELAVLHYNAGILHHDDHGALLPRRLEDETIATLVSDIQVNISGALAAAHAAATAMRERGSGGTILLTGGGLGVQPSAEFLTLSVGKAGIRAMALALFPALQEQKIHVATITVAKLVAPDSPDAAAIADAFWELHAQEPGAWQAERVYA